MPQLIQSRYAQGLAAYRSGQGVGQLIAALDKIERDASEESQKISLVYEKPEDREAAHERLRAGDFSHDAGPSLIAGFADGVIDDIRAIAGQRRGQTA
jgi:hypothetical protein